MAKQGFTVSPEEHIDIWRALGRMPYFPLTHMSRNISSGDELAKALEAFAETLRFVAKGNDEDREELTELRRQRAAIRAFIGIDNA